MVKTLLHAVLISLVLFVLCGLIYPLGMTAVGQLIFPWQANGSILTYQGKLVGSALLGQAFTDFRFLHGRVSAVNYNTFRKEDKTVDQNGKTAYTGVSSGSANLAASNLALEERVRNDITEYLKTHPDIKPEQIPTDLFTSSGSGLDPHISPAAAKIQIPLIAQATMIRSDTLEDIISRATEGRFLGIFGEPRVNVLKANLEIARQLNFRLQ